MDDVAAEEKVRQDDVKAAEQFLTPPCFHVLRHPGKRYSSPIFLERPKHSPVSMCSPEHRTMGTV